MWLKLYDGSLGRAGRPAVVRSLEWVPPRRAGRPSFREADRPEPDAVVIAGVGFPASELDVLIRRRLALSARPRRNN